MARKTLLTESELRRFMKLANMRPVGQDRMNEMYTEEAPIDLEEEEADPEALEDYAAGDLERGEPGEAAADELEAGAELDVPMDPMDGPAALDSGTEELLAKGIQAMADAMGMSDLVTVDVDGDDGAMPDDEVQVDVTDVVMDDPELGGEEGGDPVSLEPDEPMMEETDELEESNEEDIVAEVARRVAARLQREAKQAEVVDQLAERIMKRLTK